MASLDDVRSRVARSYQHLDLPSWPDPHPHGAFPREDEYSRFTEPGRYRIVHARARAWAARLGEIAEVTVETLSAPDLAADGHPDRSDRGLRLTSSRPGTLPLLLLERDVPWPELDTPLALLQVSVVRPGIALATQPECGCDACDSGSRDLLDAIDRAVGSVVGGPFVALRGRGWQAQWHPDGGSSAGTRMRMPDSGRWHGQWLRGGRRRGPDHAHVMELCRRLADGQEVRLPRGTEVFVGRSWLT
jgi:hypothetical protein